MCESLGFAPESGNLSPEMGIQTGGRRWHLEVEKQAAEKPMQMTMVLLCGTGVAIRYMRFVFKNKRKP